MIKPTNGRNSEYLYNIGYHTYEESESVQLSHPKQFAQEEFDELVANATSHVFKSDKEQNKLTFQHVFHVVVEALIHQHGFKQVAFTAEFNVFGWADILDKNDWKSDRDNQLNRLADAVRASTQ